MAHASRPLHIGRAFAQISVEPADNEPYYPTRESDGEAHVGTMLDARQLRITYPRTVAREFLQKARAARLAGDMRGWFWNFRAGSSWLRAALEKRS